MYAVIRSGGKQERVSEGELVRLELVGASVGEEVTLQPVLLVADGGEIRATATDLDGVTVTGRVVGEELGPKINAMTYKSKSNQRRRWGHRQRYSTVEILTIAAPSATGRPSGGGGTKRSGGARKASPKAAGGNGGHGAGGAATPEPGVGQGTGPE